MSHGRRLVGRHAIITGGSSGIGYATATALGRQGAAVSLIARGTERLRQAAEELNKKGVSVATASVDVTDAAALRHAIEGLVADQAPSDILITSAGISEPGYFLDLDDEVHHRVMNVNYFGTLNAIRAVAPSMVTRQHGTIVGISSAAGLLGIYGYSAYSPSKFAVKGLLECLRAEMAPHHVAVHCVFAGDVDTPQLAYETRIRPKENTAIAGSIKLQPPEHVAEVIVKGITKSRFAIIPDPQTRLLANSVSVIDGILNRVADRRVKKVQTQPDT